MTAGTKPRKADFKAALLRVLAVAMPTERLKALGETAANACEAADRAVDTLMMELRAYDLGVAVEGVVARTDAESDRLAPAPEPARATALDGCFCDYCQRARGA